MMRWRMIESAPLSSVAHAPGKVPAHSDSVIGVTVHVGG